MIPRYEMEKVYKGRTQAETSPAETSPIVGWVYENGKWIYRALTKEEWEAIVELEVGGKRDE